MIVVSDTSAIISLVRINQVNLLPLLFGKVIIPTAVKSELTNARFTDAERKTIESADWLFVKSITSEIDFINDLDDGEREAISLAKELHADFLVIDEAPGRQEAKRLGLRTIGVLGILVLAKERGIIAMVKPQIDSLIQKSEFWVSEKLITHILKQANEL